MKQHLSVHKCAILLIFAIFFSAVTASAQYEAYLHKPYAETIDSLDACLKRFEDAKMSFADETVEWNKIKTFAVTYRDKRLELSVDYYLAHNKRYKEGLPAKELIKFHQNIIDRAEKISFVEMVLTCKHTLAQVHLENKNYDASFAICKQLKQQLEQIDCKTHPDIIYVYYAIAEIYYQFQEFELAVQVLKKAIDAPLTTHNFHRHFPARNTLGLCYSNLNQPDSAMFYFQSIIDEPRFVEIPIIAIYKIVALKNIADIYFDNSEYEKTIPMYKEVFEYLSKQIFEYDFATGAAIGLAQSYLYTGNIKEAKNLLSDRLKREHIADRRLRDWFETVSIYYQKTGNYKMALAYSDSTRRLDKKEYDTVNTMRLLRVEQAANALDMKLANAEKDKIHRSFLFALGTVALLLIIAVLIFINHQKIRRKNIALVAQIRELQELQQIKEKELLQKNTFKTPETDAAELCPESRKDKICLALRDLLLKDKIYRNETLSRDSLMKELGINRHDLEDAFLLCFSMHFSEYINESRLRDAVVMLEGSDVSIAEISEKVGFGTPRTFQRQFTAKYNISPKDYRALAKGK